jgi:hypothetical protein
VACYPIGPKLAAHALGGEIFVTKILMSLLLFRPSQISGQ